MTTYDASGEPVDPRDVLDAEELADHLDHVDPAWRLRARLAQMAADPWRGVA